MIMSMSLLLASAALSVVASGCVSEQTARPSNPYGICSHFTYSDYPTRETSARMIREAGAGWVRFDFDWTQIEPEPGSFTFEVTDDAVATAEKAGLGVCAIVGKQPRYAKPAYEHLDLWTNFVATVVSRYKSRIRVWEVWNEPNNSGDPLNDPTNYLQVLRAAYMTIKAIDPTLFVTSGGIAGLGKRYVEPLLALGAGTYFDAMNFHPYCIPQPPEEPLLNQIRWMREKMTQYGCGDKPIWATEMGWPTHHVSEGRDPGVSHTPVPESLQASYTARALGLAMAGGLDAFFIYNLRASERRLWDRESHFGLIRKNSEPKAAYYAYSAFTAARPAGSRQRTDLPWRQDSIFMPQWRRPGGEDAGMIWKTDGLALLVCTFNGDVRFVDMYGRRKSFAKEGDGVYRLHVGADPVYFCGAELVSAKEEK